MIRRRLDALIRALDAGAPLVDLLIRFYLAQVFFRSGLVKIGNWQGTLYLFREEYRVPLLAPEVAAAAGTCAELVFPLLLVVGLASRFAAFSLSLVNAVAVISFWHVLCENDAALMAHFYWALLLAVPLFHGPGRLSLDHFLAARVAQPAAARQ